MFKITNHTYNIYNEVTFRLKHLKNINLPIKIILILLIIINFINILNNNIIYYVNYLKPLNYIYTELYLLNYIVILILYIYILVYYINKFIIKKNKSLNTFMYFLIILSILCIVSTNNLLIFFIGYELVLIPSAVLVFLQSPNRRSYIVTGYFLLWTQLGSFFVLISTVVLYNTYNITSFSSLNLLLNFFNLKFVILLLIVGFSIKIPTWPFHFWLTKTHVEANTSFSIFLSGILVKTALIGIFKFNVWFYNYKYFIILVVLFGIFDVTFKLFYQTDFKKLTAYLTIQEMGLLLILSLFVNTQSNETILKFIILHTVLSALLFYTSELLYSRTGSRQLNITFNLIKMLPNLTLFLYITMLLFIGLPLTLKFFIELLLILKILTFNKLFYFIFFISVQLLTIIFFFKNLISLFFMSGDIYKTDLNKTEIVLYLYLILPTLYIGVL